jgi:Fanconi-associated nuclease 1
MRTLEEASSLLKLEELRLIAKGARIKGKNKSDLLEALQRMSQNQTSLEWASLKRANSKKSTNSSDSGVEMDGGAEHMKLNETDGIENNAAGSYGKNRDKYFMQKIMACIGPCIRLSLTALKLFERVHLVFYRSTEWTDKSLTTIILARILRRNFPPYIVSRSANIFESRSTLLEFEAAVRTQYRVDSILEFNGSPKAEGLQDILSIFEEVYPRWKILLEEEQRKEDRIYDTGEGAYLRRFSPAHIYTRIIHKAASVLGKYKLHEREHEVLTDLLDQRLFHAARRGSWYQRKALLEEHYMFALQPVKGITSLDGQKKHWRQISLNTCEQGLQDRECHLIYHYDLQKRIRKLEKSLKLAKREQHDFGHVSLWKPIERCVKGIQVIKNVGRFNFPPWESERSIVMLQ